MKRCTRCREWRALTEYPPHKRMRDGRASWCRECCREYRRQTYVPRPREIRSLADRFWDRVERRGPDECWPWKSSLLPSGYGAFSWREDGRVVGRPAHRVAYELAVGPIPDGLTIDHLCNNRGCVNPAHLEPVTHQENMDRAVARREAVHAAGEDCGGKVCLACRAFRSEAAS